MIDSRLLYSFFQDFRVKGFFFFFYRSGLTIADLKICGKLPERIDSFMTAEKYARRWSRHLFKRDVGRGSSSQILIADILHCELRDRAEVSQRCARKTVVAHYRQRNSLRIKVVSIGYYHSSKEVREPLRNLRWWNGWWQRRSFSFAEESVCDVEVS